MPPPWKVSWTTFCFLAAGPTVSPSAVSPLGVVLGGSTAAAVHGVLGVGGALVSAGAVTGATDSTETTPSLRSFLPLVLDAHDLHCLHALALLGFGGHAGKLPFLWGARPCFTRRRGFIELKESQGLDELDRGHRGHALVLAKDGGRELVHVAFGVGLCWRAGGKGQGERSGSGTRRRFDVNYVHPLDKLLERSPFELENWAASVALADHWYLGAKCAKASARLQSEERGCRSGRMCTCRLHSLDWTQPLLGIGELEHGRIA